MRLLRISLFALWTLAAMACGREVKNVPATAVVVAVNSHIAALASLRVTVLDAAGTKPGGTGTFSVDGDKAKFPFSFTVAPPSGSTTGRFNVRVDGLDDQNVVLASVQAQGTFIRQETRLMALWLAELCQGVRCDEAQTCHYEVGDPKAGQCGDILVPKLTDFEPGADEDLSQFPTLAPPKESVETGSSVAVENASTSKSDAGSSTADAAQPPLETDAGDASTDAGPALPPTSNLPTVGNFRSLGARRPNADSSLVVFDDGFEESGKVCNADGLCAVAGITP